MRNVLALTVLAAALFAPVAFAGDSETGMQWRKDYAKALTEATEAKKQLFIEFTAVW